MSKHQFPATVLLKFLSTVAIMYPLDEDPAFATCHSVDRGFFHLRKQNIFSLQEGWDILKSLCFLDSGWFQTFLCTILKYKFFFQHDFYSYCWFSPLSLRNHTFTEESDIWTFGVTLWEMFAMKRPFHCSLTGKVLLEEEVHLLLNSQKIKVYLHVRWRYQCSTRVWMSNDRHNFKNTA